MQIDEALLYREIGARLRRRRAEAGLTQAQLADLIGVLRTSITNLEAGRQKAPLPVLYDACLALGVEIAAILPTVAEVAREVDLPVEVAGAVEAVPPRTAAFLRELLDEG